ncbi:MAG: DivIVA domain-containing protein [Defluviitaleaceae bacterium]|nr:DivIVA domain-containing protein [Defluviitaleaceae bacterium]
MSDRFNITKRGYEIEEVDAYISKLERTITEYKDKDAAIKNAIINSQIAADNIIDRATIEAEKIKLDALRQVSDIQNSINSQRRLVDEFVEDYMAFVKRYIVEFSEVNTKNIYSKIQSLEDYFSSIKNENIKKDDEKFANSQGFIDGTHQDIDQ